MKIWVLLFAALASASPVIAQEPTPPLVPQHSQSIMETLIKAGPVMIPLFLLSIFFVMLVVVYLMTIRRGAVVSSGYMATADALLRKRDYLGLLAVSNRHGEAIARVVQKMLDFTTKNPHADFQLVREIAETEGTRVAASLILSARWERTSDRRGMWHCREGSVRHWSTRPPAWPSAFQR